MKFNDWEHCDPEKFLWNTPKEDFEGIVSYIKEVKAKVVMEFGFGTGVLLPELIKLDIQYWGYDKTVTFVNSTRIKYWTKMSKFHFGVMDIEDLEHLSDEVGKIRPDLLLLRNTLEYLPSWPVVIDHLNNLKVKDIIISTFSAPAEKSRSEVQFSVDKKNAYTMNFISGEELDSYLSSYDKVKEVRHGERAMFRAYHLRKQ